MARQSIKSQEMTGLRFGRLVVLQYENFKKVYVACDCGRRKVVCVSSLRKGSTTSCGCARAEQLANRNRKHGLTGTREYSIWKNIKSRCLNPNNPKYYMWGGRGIEVCDRWSHSFAAFVADMGPCPSGYSIDRINNSGNYEPGNCRWASPKEQASNTRRNVVVEHDGRRQSVSQWARDLGINPNVIHKRIFRGQEPHMALFGY